MDRRPGGARAGGGDRRGGGIFFVSQAAEPFEIDSNPLAWRVDNLRAMAVKEIAPPTVHTRVRFA
ncbi:MAG: hypothetical protein COW73_08740 [Nitrospirae bacterium CG18_big_fil_WC_8_21_14_2_50_70_55]|nr:hypothetical protein [Deltaproteobacteria bacterium]OIP61802.1 MAG: hypothetical protein AUK30_11395 [Nitrospirae bacterium CG2_30_70_394]PIQ04197.1 MAG: hypothetical protein COW73_08740 [Nitrospirae bacterium CG18_big_fil_WC_8_21_14_2_50_70_55]PIU79804.1 MAG: hypothetical protein COS73_02750 [Nitrospirae bacterium CG06_land_8_20_14_3_00_70_43]PIW82614.1 MAG: hypothetical protein COZ96_07700 [Nitrospirae bacterium CG_4_8_14_3_um_filter_70_85]PIX83871.1 MAG: hypothetical protein COZ33_03225 